MARYWLCFTISQKWAQGTAPNATWWVLKIIYAGTSSILELAPVTLSKESLHTSDFQPPLMQIEDSVIKKGQY
jgi:hypothetical protein